MRFCVGGLQSQQRKYRLTIQLVAKFRFGQACPGLAWTIYFSMRPMHYATFVLVSMGGWEQHEWSLCISAASQFKTVVMHTSRVGFKR